MQLVVSLSATRLSKEDFDKLSASDKKKYVEDFPHTTHVEETHSVTGKKIPSSKDVAQQNEQDKAKAKEQAAKEAEEKAAEKAKKEPFSIKKLASAISSSVKMTPKLANAWVKAREEIKNDPYVQKQIKKDNRDAAMAAGASAAISIAGALAGAIKGAKAGLAIKNMLINTLVFKGTVAGGVKAGAASMAVMGAAPGLLLGVAVAGLWMHSKVKRQKKAMKRAMESVSSNINLKEIQNDIVEGLEIIRKEGFQPWQKELLEDHYKIKL